MDCAARCDVVMLATAGVRSESLSRSIAWSAWATSLAVGRSVASFDNRRVSRLLSVSGSFGFD
jgi:hypothetical protein